METVDRTDSENYRSNPMTNELVLENVFEFCTVSTLKNCRLVCTSWKDLSMKSWRNKAVLCLDKDSGLKFVDYLRTCESEDNDVPKNLNRYPFKHFRLQSEEACQSASVKSSLAVFNVAQHLELRDGLVNVTDLKRYLRKFKTLKSLELRNFDLHGGDPDKPRAVIPTLHHLKICQNQGISDLYWECVLNCFPKIETLSFEKHPNASASYFADMISSLMSAAKNIRLRDGENAVALKELEVVGDCSGDINDLDDDGFLSIARCEFALEELHIAYPLDIQKICCPLLQSCKDTLLRLKLTFSTWKFANYDGEGKVVLRPYECIGQPLCLSELREINFINGFPWGLYLLAHLELPKLKKLNLQTDRNGKAVYVDNLQLMLQLGKVYECLDTFEFHENQKIPGKVTIMSFASMMPNLTSLTAPLDKQTFRIVCEHFKALKILKILDGVCDYEEIDDEAMTGIGLEKGNNGRLPNITNLQNLVSFTISCEKQLRRNDVKFTDHSVIDGFLGLPQLQLLSIAFKQLSDDVKAKLFYHVQGNVHIQERKNVKQAQYLGVQVGNEANDNDYCVDGNTLKTQFKECTDDEDDEFGYDSDGRYYHSDNDEYFDYFFE